LESVTAIGPTCTLLALDAHPLIAATAAVSMANASTSTPRFKCPFFFSVFNCIIALYPI
jgi:hypothetical protein